MNERIKELVEQAKIKVWHNDGGLLSDKAFEIVAELIVGECADLCSDLDGGENMFSRGIRKHFGVEE